MIQYGLISKVDSAALEKTIDLICDEFNLVSEVINITEIGLFNCQTLFGMNEYVNKVKKRNVHCIGIDNEKDKPIENQLWFEYIKGNSNEVYNQLEDNSQHLIFVDGCHALPYVIADFFCYEDKVKTGGYFAFHDTGSHISEFKDYQRVGSKGDPDMYISVRKALKKIGVLGDELWGWRVVFDEADPNDEAGGIVVLKKYMN